MGIKVRKYWKQKMVYWEKTGSGNAGQSTFKSPVEVKVRWEDRQEQVILLDGRTIVSNAHIMCSQKIVHGSVVMKGTLADWKKMPTYPKVPTTQQGGKEVFKTGETPDKKGRDLLFEAWL